MKRSSALQWRRQLLVLATLMMTATLMVQVKGQEADGSSHDDVPPLILPPLRPLPESSFRGPFADDLQVPHFEASGQTLVVPADKVVSSKLTRLSPPLFSTL